MGKKRPVNATVDELLEVKEELLAAIEGLRGEAATKLQCQEDRSTLVSQIKVLETQVYNSAALAEESDQQVADNAREYADSVAAGALDSSKNLVHELRDLRSTAETALEEKIEQVDTAMRTSFVDELTSLCENLDKRFSELHQELVDHFEARLTQVTAAFSAQLDQLQATVTADREGSAADRATLRKDLADEAEKLREEVSQDLSRLDREATAARGQLEERINLLSGTVYQNRLEASGGIDHTRDEVTAALQNFQQSAEHRLDSLERHTEELGDDVNEVRNATARRVEWKIAAASTTLELPKDVGSDGFRKWLSPPFHAGGARNLQLELRRFATGAKGEGSGDCALFLWGNRGLNIAFRLFIGNKSSTLEKVFGARESHGTKRLCALQEQISKEEDSLLVGLEVLELVGKQDVPATLQRADAAGADGAQGPFEGSLLCQRHVNNRLLPAVRKEVDRMQSRMVKRIEWLLEQVSSLPQHFPNRHQLCSPVFSAAGIDGMQLIFYPAGYMGASPGFCSLFIFCPAGVTMKGHISAGRQKREANYTFDEGCAKGRTNFCRFDSLLDETDTLLLTLEFEECRQEVTATVGDPPAFSGELKLTKMPGQASLLDTKTLPSLWSSQALGDVSKGADTAGCHSFSSLKHRPKPPSRGRTGAAVSVSTVEQEPSFPPPHFATAPAGAPGFASQRAASTPVLELSSGTQSPRQPDILPALNSQVRTRRPGSLKRPLVLASPPFPVATTTP